MNYTRMAACPDSPNCVSSLSGKDDKEHYIEPIPYQPLSRQEAIERIREIVNGMARAEILVDEEDYIHAVYTTLIFRFKDDVEFYLPPHQFVIEIRSASRVGYSDLGANRKRMEQFRRSFNEGLTASNVY